MICFAQRARKFQLTLDEEEAVFILGLQPGRTYQVEIDDEEIFETDSRPRRNSGAGRAARQAGRRAD